ncbi:MAG: prepilin-type N-terminal cleavage/methylation domain-containing protein [Candidatus Omnitrophota bacterium]
MFNLFNSIKKNKEKLRTGFTLVEMLVSMVIFLILLSAVHMVMSTGQKTFYSGSVSVDIQHELRKLKEYMVKELMQGREMNVAITNGDTIDFSIPSTVDNGGSITWQPIRYRHEADLRQVLRDSQGSTKVIANNITTLALAQIVSEPHLINVAATSEKTGVMGRTITYISGFDVRLRN